MLMSYNYIRSNPPCLSYCVFTFYMNSSDQVFYNSWGNWIKPSCWFVIQEHLPKSRRVPTLVEICQSPITTSMMSMQTKNSNHKMMLITWEGMKLFNQHYPGFEITKKNEHTKSRNEHLKIATCDAWKKSNILSVVQWAQMDKHHKSCRMRSFWKQPNRHLLKS